MCVNSFPLDSIMVDCSSEVLDAVHLKMCIFYSNMIDKTDNKMAWLGLIIKSYGD